MKETGCWGNARASGAIWAYTVLGTTWHLSLPTSVSTMSVRNPGLRTRIVWCPPSSLLQLPSRRRSSVAANSVRIPLSCSDLPVTPRAAGIPVTASRTSTITLKSMIVVQSSGVRISQLESAAAIPDTSNVRETVQRCVIISDRNCDQRNSQQRPRCPFRGGGRSHSHSWSLTETEIPDRRATAHGTEARSNAPMFFGLRWTTSSPRERPVSESPSQA